jgi:DNA polymerase V
MRVPQSQIPVLQDYLKAFLREFDSTSSVTLIGPVEATATCPRPLPLMAWPVRAGFPSPAEDYQEESIDLNTLLAPHTEATFLVRVSGESMNGAGIDHGDVLVVDRSLEPAHGRIVVAVVDGEFTVKRLYRRDGQISLEASNPDFPPIVLQEGQELAVWGVVTRIIKSV